VNLEGTEQQTVLLAEDIESMRTFVSRVLIQSGFNVIAATNGKDAIQRAQEHKGKIALLLSDIEMPEMTGIELAAQIKLSRPDIKIMLMSGSRSEIVLRDDWEFLPKPFTPDMLNERIRALLSRESEQAPPSKDMNRDPASE
jgi:two-component system, cell cycle sensor histidine kinase and response regulator CckA